MSGFDPSAVSSHENLLGDRGSSELSNSIAEPRNVRREAAQECSPGRKPWVELGINKPRRGERDFVTPGINQRQAFPESQNRG